MEKEQKEPGLHLERTQVEGGAGRAHALSGLALPRRAERGHLEPVGSRLRQLREELVRVLIHAGGLRHIPCGGEEMSNSRCGWCLSPAPSPTVSVDVDVEAVIAAGSSRRQPAQLQQDGGQPGGQDGVPGLQVHGRARLVGVLVLRHHGVDKLLVSALQTGLARVRPVVLSRLVGAVHGDGRVF